MDESRLLELVRVVRKSATRVQAQLCRDGYLVVDLTSTSNDPRGKKFSPFYPNAVPPGIAGAALGIAGTGAASVEGLWQGLKVFDHEGIDESKLRITNMRGLKRAAHAGGRGACVGHRIGDQMLGYLEARRQIYLPAYEHVLDAHLGAEVEWLTEQARLHGGKLALLDYETNEDVEDDRKPLSHASIVKRRIIKCLLCGPL